MRGLDTRVPGLSPFDDEFLAAYLDETMFSGTVRVRDVLRFPGGESGKVTAISVFDRGPTVRIARMVSEPKQAGCARCGRF